MIGERVDGGGGVHSFANESGAEAGDAVRLPAFAPGVRHTFVQDAAGGARTVCAHAPGDGLAGLLRRAPG